MNTPLSKNVQRVEPSATMVISTQAKAMKARGIDVISLSVGEPDFDTPQHIKDAAIRAIRDGVTKYTPAVGTPELRRAVCDKFQRDNGLTYEPTQIVVGCGGKHVIFETMQALLNEGDEVIVPAPYWVSYPEQVKLLGAQPVIVQPSSAHLKITGEELRQAITPKTKLLVLNSPSNPLRSLLRVPERFRALRRKLWGSAIDGIGGSVHLPVGGDARGVCARLSLRDGCAHSVVLRDLDGKYPEGAGSDGGRDWETAMNNEQ